MTAENRASIEMRFGDGVVFRAWDQVKLRDSFTDPLGSLEFAAQPPRNLWPLYDEHLQKGELVAVLVNGAPQGNHLIQTRDKRIGKNGVEWQIECQSVLCTAYEGGADPNYALSTKTDTTVTTAVNDILRPYFGAQTEVHANAEDDVVARMGKKLKGAATGIDVEALKHQDCQVHENETAYGVIDRIINRLGLIVRVDVAGRILLCRPLYDTPARYTVVQDFQMTRKGDRFLDDPPIEVHDTNSGQFSECVVRGQRADRGEQTQAAQPIGRVGADVALPDGVPFAKVPRALLEPGRHNYRSDVAPYKPKFYKDKKARDVERSRSLARMILGFKCKEAFYVSGTVDGWLSREGHVWTVNTMARVVVEADKIDEDMLLLERTLMMDRSGGQRTYLKFIPKGSLIIGELPS